MTTEEVNRRYAAALHWMEMIKPGMDWEAIESYIAVSAGHRALAELAHETNVRPTGAAVLTPSLRNEIRGWLHSPPILADDPDPRALPQADRLAAALRRIGWAALLFREILGEDGGPS